MLIKQAIPVAGASSKLKRKEQPACQPSKAQLSKNCPSSPALPPKLVAHTARAQAHVAMPTLPHARCQRSAAQSFCCIHTDISPEDGAELPAHALWTANAVVDPATGALLKHKDFKIGPASEEWIQGASNKMGRLAEGVQPHMPTGSKTTHFMHRSEMPEGHKATQHLNIMASCWGPQKAEKEQAQFSVGRD